MLICGIVHFKYVFAWSYIVYRSVVFAFFIYCIYSHNFTWKKLVVFFSQIQNLFTCMDTIQHVEWSSDSQFILCGLYKRGLVQVWSLEQPDWKCKIDEGSAGLCAVRYNEKYSDCHCLDFYYHLHYGISYTHILDFLNYCLKHWWLFIINDLF